MLAPLVMFHMFQTFLLIMKEVCNEGDKNDKHSSPPSSDGYVVCLSNLCIMFYQNGVHCILLILPC